LLLFSFSFFWSLCFVAHCFATATPLQARTHARTQAPATQGLRESHPNQRLISPKHEIKNKIENEVILELFNRQK
jgi:hypothetical protein